MQNQGSFHRHTANSCSQKMRPLWKNGAPGIAAMEFRCMMPKNYLLRRPPNAFVIDAMMLNPNYSSMESSGKKTPLIDRLLILGGAATFILLTVTFSPMLWMATILAVLPVVAMLVLITPTLHLNIVEKQTEDNRAK